MRRQADQRRSLTSARGLVASRKWLATNCTRTRAGPHQPFRKLPLERCPIPCGEDPGAARVEQITFLGSYERLVTGMRILYGGRLGCLPAWGFERRGRLIRSLFTHGEMLPAFLSASAPAGGHTAAVHGAAPGTPPFSFPYRPEAKRGRFTSPPLWPRNFARRWKCRRIQAIAAASCQINLRRLPKPVQAGRERSARRRAGSRVASTRSSASASWSGVCPSRGCGAGILPPRSSRRVFPCDLSGLARLRPVEAECRWGVLGASRLVIEAEPFQQLTTQALVWRARVHPERHGAPVALRRILLMLSLGCWSSIFAK